ncbi:metallophosphoesterase [Nesterenkonia sp. YGD6]|uniref:metallophosphoesterase n=1 Tax=unclassified Nesterenkonia TaxID=2629769 RepID=UPI001F4C9B2B|nr:metallophosphoesterase [Nesterenkonia sp. YGD6]
MGLGVNDFRTRHVTVPLRAGAGLRILHISDIHYVPGQRKKFAWLQSLADLKPDLVINTGDNLSHPDAVGEVLQALEPLRRFPGVFVGGSNDYYAPTWKNPLRYFRGPSSLDAHPKELDWQRLFGGFESSGWKNLNNQTAQLTVAGRPLAFSGVDDPHIARDEFQGWPAPGESVQEQGSIPDPLRIGLAHAPVSAALATLAGSGAELILAGHTHGGQVCLPGGRALVTNCDLPRPQAKGLSSVQVPAQSVPGQPGEPARQVPLHVSAGIGTSRTAPVRLFCPPEATLIEVQHETT